MKIKIKGIPYDVSPSFMTMVKYRCEYGVSVMQEEITNDDTLIKLLYTAIVGEKPFYHEFKAECMGDSSFELSALAFYKTMLLKDSPQKNEAQSSGSPDEFEILSLCTIANIDIKLLEIMNIFQVIRLINKYCEIKNATPKPKEMSEDERKAFYGITAEKEAKIETFLAAKSEV